jgi:hypothetical protein
LDYLSGVSLGNRLVDRLGFDGDTGVAVDPEKVVDLLLGLPHRYLTRDVPEGVVPECRQKWVKERGPRIRFAQSGLGVGRQPRLDLIQNAADLECRLALGRH